MIWKCTRLQLGEEEINIDNSSAPALATRSKSRRPPLSINTDSAPQSPELGMLRPITVSRETPANSVGFWKQGQKTYFLNQNRLSVEQQQDVFSSLLDN